MKLEDSPPTDDPGWSDWFLGALEELDPDKAESPWQPTDAQRAYFETEKEAMWGDDGRGGSRDL